MQGQNVTPIVYTWGGGAIGAEATGLPEGFTATKDASSKTLTITGTSTETLSKTTYTVTTTGAGNTVTLNGTITVTADPNAATLTSSANMTQTVTEGQSIESMTFTYGGGATGITVENLPAGLTQSTSGKTLTIAGTPTASGTFTVKTTGGSVNKTQTATVNVASAIAEDFEGETASASSSEKDINLSTGLYTFYRAKINTDYNNTEGGSNAVQLNYQKGYIITPEMIGTQTVSFYVKTKKKEATLNVSYSADGGTTWKTLENATVTSTTFIQKSYKISETGNIILKIENDGGASGSTDYNLYVDDLDFTAAGNTTSVDEEMKDEAENIDWKITGSEVTLTGAEVVKIVIYDFSSHIVIKGGEFASSVNTSGLSAGDYVAVAVLPNGKTMAKKFMKR